MKLQELVEEEERQRVQEDLERVVEMAEALEMVERWWSTEQRPARFRYVGAERSHWLLP